MQVSENFQTENQVDQRKVLIVDDDTDFAESLADILELQGYKEFIANNHFDAIKIVEEESPHVALLDIRLGNSSGIDLISLIKDKRPDILCIMVTAYAELETAITALQKGAYDYLRKPIEAHNLLTTLEHCFENILLQREKEAVQQSLKQRNKDLEEANMRLRKESQRTNQAIEQLRLSEARYRYLFEGAPVGLIELDVSGVVALLPDPESADGKEITRFLAENSSIFAKISDKVVIKDINAEALRILEADDKEQISSGFSEVVESDAMHLVKRCLMAFFAGKDSVEVETRYTTIKRNPIHILARIDFQPENQPINSLLVSFLDISERKQAEEALEEEKEKFKTLVEEAPFGISIYDRNGRCKYLNPKKVEMFGYDIEECSTVEAWFENLFPDSEYKRYVIAEKERDYKLLSEGKSIAKSFNVTCKDGTVKTILFRIMFLGNGDEVVLSEDISQQLRMEEQMVQAQKMEAVGTLAGGVAHDFNNLLQAIQGYSQLLIIDKPANDLETTKIKEIIKASERASELTKQLLAFSRKVESKLRPTNLNQVIHQVNKLLSRTIPRMISIELDLEDKIDVINADPIQMEQVLMNMAINARDAMPDGGRLSISTANVQLGEEFCRDQLGLVPGKYVELKIADTGQGLDRDTIEHIFEPFFTTKGIGKGTGLGLSMVYGIIKNHGGHIQCTSQPCAGATFQIYLPTVKSTVEQTEEVVDSKITPGGSETILLVDDEKLLRDIGTAILSKFGYKVLSCTDGESAIQIYQKKKSAISLVILDLIMPGMGGKRCLQELMKIDPNIKVVIASGYAGDAVSMEGIEHLIKGFIKKPYDINQMLYAIRTILDDERSE